MMDRILHQSETESSAGCDKQKNQKTLYDGIPCPSLILIASLRVSFNPSMVFILSRMRSISVNKNFNNNTTLKPLHLNSLISIYLIIVVHETTFVVYIYLSTWFIYFDLINHVSKDHMNHNINICHIKKR